MPADLDSLLADVGRAPTVDVDVEAVVARGRRRARRRTVGAVAGAAAVVAGVAAVVTSALPMTPTVDVAPAPPASTPSATPSITDRSTTGRQGASDGPSTQRPVAVGDAALAARLGLAVDRLRVDLATDGYVVATTSPAGEVVESPWTEEVDHLGLPVHTDDGAWWALTPDGTTVRRDPDGDVTTAAAATDGIAWLPVGVAADGIGVLVTEEPVGGASFGGEPPEVRVLTADGMLAAMPGVDVAAAMDEEWAVVAAAAAPDLLVVVVNIGESYEVVAHPAGGEPVVLAETGGLDRWFEDVAVVGDEAWIGEVLDRGEHSRILRVPLAGGDADVVDLPGLALHGIAALPDDTGALLDTTPGVDLLDPDADGSLVATGYLVARAEDGSVPAVVAAGREGVTVIGGADIVRAASVPTSPTPGSPERMPPEQAAGPAPADPPPTR